MKSEWRLLRDEVYSQGAAPSGKVFAAFPYAVGISDINNDTIFECLSARRKDFDPEAKTVTYVWSLNDGPGKRYFLRCSAAECTLWVSKAVEDLVPVSCLEQFHDVCGVMVPLRDSDLCLDDENDVDDDDNGN
ncbi:hypothetical protein HPB52_002147 [Rhipicephalus sanguineus]|uniref:Uncharacterized protein n=1 Tax=Rhipicephalus sanguineus TaxID=34632 RepID=A0A9D4PKD8_RHISA|nr:hypothetical protein HPB52_002147 [Rhipicephalus sanguineus]